MRVRYPMLCTWVRLETKSPVEIVIKNCLTEEEFITDQGEQFVNYIKRLDGKTNPYTIDDHYSRKEVAAILNQLKEFDLIRENRVLQKQPGSVNYTLFFFHPNDMKKNRLAPVLNCLLYLLCIPVLILGVALLFREMPDIENINALGMICGVLIGAFMHEAGHGIGTVAYGGHVYEAGISLDFIFPGFYVLSQAADCSKLNKAQISAAGIEANLLISGLFMIIASRNTIITEWAFSVAASNITLALINLLFINGLDGSDIISDLFGLEVNIIPLAIQSLKSKSIRKELKSNGLKGHLIYISFCVIAVLQISLPLLILLDIMGVVLWFL